MTTSFVLIHHFTGGTAEQYANTLAGVHPDGGKGLPPGQTSHYAGPTADGWVIVGLWDSEASWVRFRDETLLPGFDEIEDPLPGPPEEITFTVQNSVSA